ncbi:uncharacterized protein LOC106867195 isoform X3 [Octopus bimaculoides]|nr:uncharacterized protein LOC106867195 isoform X3 [Octopus bimaculoides]XP_052822623.1 uncharacterized protein LOC106867195 isoform X3 [Octopus bimaculoides]
MSSVTPPANVTDQQLNGSAYFEDSPETNENSEANVNDEDYLEMVLNVENELEGNSEQIQLYHQSARNPKNLDKSRKRKKKKSKKHKELLADENNDDSVIADEEENNDDGSSKKKKRKKIKKHESITEENEDSNIGDVLNIDEVDGVKKKKKKHKKHKKEEDDEEEEEEIFSHDAEVKIEGSMDVDDSDCAISSDDDFGNGPAVKNNKIDEGQKKVKKEKEESNLLISKNRKQKWPKEDVLRLLVSLQNNLSDSKTLKTEELWQRVQFDSYTPEDCKDMYTAAVSKVRKIRTMLEIVKDAIKILPTLNSPKTYTKALPKPKPMTPFRLYIESHRKKALKKFPQLRQINILNRLSKQWISLDNKKKMKYIVQAQDWEKKYLEEVKEYKRVYPDFTMKPVFSKFEQKMLLRRLGIPEKPCSNGFGLFIKTSGHLLVDVKSTERMKGLSKIFNDLPAAVKEDYENRNRLEKIEYQEKVYEYVSKLSPEECLLTINSKLVEEQLQLKKRSRPASAFLLYYSENKDSLPDLCKTERYKTLQKRWKLLPKASQESYKLQRKEMHKSLKSKTGKQKIASSSAPAAAAI